MFLMPAHEKAVPERDAQTQENPSGVVYSVRDNRQKAAAG